MDSDGENDGEIVGSPSRQGLVIADSLIRSVEPFATTIELTSRDQEINVLIP